MSINTGYKTRFHSNKTPLEIKKTSETRQLLEYFEKHQDWINQSSLMSLRERFSKVADITSNSIKMTNMFFAIIFKQYLDRGFLNKNMSIDKALQTLGTYYKSDHDQRRAELAFKLFQLAVEQGNVKASSFLGHCYQYGKGVTENLRQAIKYYAMGADQEDPEALCSLGLCFKKGIGVEKNAREAVKCFQRAADQNYAKGKVLLALCYKVGEGIEKDEKKAFALFKSSADQGYSEGQFLLGRWYEDSLEKKDLEIAKKYYELAALQGHLQAKESLDSMVS